MDARSPAPVSSSRFSFPRRPAGARALGALLLAVSLLGSLAYAEVADGDDCLALVQLVVDPEEQDVDRSEEATLTVIALDACEQPLEEAFVVARVEGMNGAVTPPFIGTTDGDGEFDFGYQGVFTGYDNVVVTAVYPAGRVEPDQSRTEMAAALVRWHPASCAEGPCPPDPDALLANWGAEADLVAEFPEVAMYAAEHDVTLEEANLRIDLQEPVGDLGETLEEMFPEHYAGLRIEHQPEWRVIVRFTVNPERGELLLAPLIEDTPLAGLTMVREAPYSVLDLDVAIESILDIAPDVPFDLEGDLEQGRIKIYVDTQASYDAFTDPGLDLPPMAEVHLVEYLSGPEANIYGGLSVIAKNKLDQDTTCTTGFSVVEIEGKQRKGISTAGHCRRPVRYKGNTLTHPGAGASKISGKVDARWLLAPGYKKKPWVRVPENNGKRYRKIKKRFGRGKQSEGDWVCIYGQTSGLKCGKIAHKTYKPDGVSKAKATFIKVARGDGKDITKPGDSGGPWFIKRRAYGIHHGRGNGEEVASIYMAVNFLKEIGVRVRLAS